MRVLFSRSVIVLVLSVLSFHINSKEPEFETFKTKGLEIRKLMGIIPTSDWKKYVSWVKGGEDTDINTYDPDTTVTRVLCMYPEGFRGKVILCFF
ncbi:MAG: hypothetical protein NTY22_05065, partial [Proteobacteria bacterium]|nr:hypothetical protein [Pseudomonadota bacterium]